MNARLARMGGRRARPRARATNRYVRRLGELYESKRDYAKAAENYQRFIALWAKAEPELQPIVEDARQRLRRMANVERPAR
ncbi:MAG: hypothetical protein ACRENH_17235 [Gemmatimonadaceae bacterium]